jgi:xanthine dehydrogenase accessory factor
MMSINDNWLDAACQNQAAILITVAASSGSVPRGAGAKMVVTGAQQFDTIGGGHLEHQAVALARSMLKSSSQYAPVSALPPGLHEPAPGLPLLQRFALGPSLGQCCGGVVHLLFEALDAAQSAQWQEARLRQLAGQDSWRELALDSAAPARWFSRAPSHLSAASAHTCHLWQDAAGQRYLLDPITAPRANLLLFGAGHVASHLIHQLAHLPCRIRWIDQRTKLFPASVPPHVAIEVNPFPQDVIASAPPNSTFLVMTHEHALDQTLVEAVLRKGDALWLGLIGSATKRAQFEHRLRARGVLDSQLAQLVCPIGLPGIESKLPAVIASAVLAQLLQVWQAAGQLETN